MFHPRSFFREVRGEKSLIFQAVGAEVSSRRTNQAFPLTFGSPSAPLRSFLWRQPDRRVRLDFQDKVEIGAENLFFFLE